MIDQSELINRLTLIEESIAQFYKMLSDELPIQIFHFKSIPVRCFVLFDQPVLYAPDVIRIIDPEYPQTNFSNAPNMHSRFGLERDVHYIVSSVGRIASECEVTPDYLLAKAKLSDKTRGMTFILPHGVNLLRIYHPEFYQWYCDTVFPSVPRLYNISNKRRESLALVKGGAL